MNSFENIVPMQIRNSGSTGIPEYGPFLVKEIDDVSSSNQAIEVSVLSPSGNDLTNEAGTFGSDLHYHNKIGFALGHSIKPGARGKGYIEISSIPLKAAVEGEEVSTTDILIMTSDSAKLKKLDRGTEEEPGDFTNIFGMFRPLKKSSDGIWYITPIDRPFWRVKVLSSTEKGSTAVAQVMQQGNQVDSSIESEITPVNITFFANRQISADEVVTIGLIAGAIVEVGSGSVKPTPTPSLCHVFVPWGFPNGGTLGLTYVIRDASNVARTSTLTLPWNCTASDLSTALLAHTGIVSDSSLFEIHDGPWPFAALSIVWKGRLLTSTPDLPTVNVTGLTGGTASHLMIWPAWNLV
ncbi:hypothetical protein SH668x_001280 [Planctomicrobium sp. SH668]|uniref:hypothetical protein n=1 Tax=Planctomicrobium sp. SH668 TaxID=3448126 RepID=UPI003F5B3481